MIDVEFVDIFIDLVTRLSVAVVFSIISGMYCKVGKLITSTGIDSSGGNNERYLRMCTFLMQVTVGSSLSCAY